MGRTPPSAETPTGSRWQATPDHRLGYARSGTYQTLGAFEIILTLSKNCNVKPVYIENGQGMFYPYSGGCAALTFS